MAFAEQLQFQSTLPVRGATTKIDSTRRIRIFQSTLPVRGATKAVSAYGGCGIFQSTLPVRGATYFCPCLRLNYVISIHAPREGSDVSSSDLPVSLMIFQSTLPVRGATGGQLHGLLVHRHFNPRSP